MVDVASRLRVELGKIAYFLNVVTPKKTFGGEYEHFSVEGKTVLDIGASIGDTAIYFIEKGAKRVIAYESDWFVYMRGLRELNKKGYIKNGSVKMVHKFVKDLDAIAAENNLHNAVLKMDIEGGEYACMERATPGAFKDAFEEVMMEYHHGPDKLKIWFENNGYSVEDEPHGTTNGMIVGMIYAKRTD
jgi:hypothetical protein